jgi:hypothetical protein
MATNRPDPGDFLDMAQRMLRELFGDRRDDDARDRDPRDDEEPWAAATRGSRGTGSRYREPSAREQRENLTFALATRAVEALEDLALNVAAIRQRLERTAPQPPESHDPGAADS